MINCEIDISETLNNHGNSNFGTISGINQSNGVISNCYSFGSIKSTPGSTGGLVGQNNGIIIDCFAHIDIESSYIVGGLVGYNRKNLRNCYYLGDITLGDRLNIFGTVVGYCSDGALVENCYAFDNLNQLMGLNDFSANIKEIGNITFSDVIGKEELLGFDFQNTWEYNQNFLLPVLKNVQVPRNTISPSVLEIEIPFGQKISLESIHKSILCPAVFWVAENKEVIEVNGQELTGKQIGRTILVGYPVHGEKLSISVKVTH